MSVMNSKSVLSCIVNIRRSRHMHSLFEWTDPYLVEISVVITKEHKTSFVYSVVLIIISSGYVVCSINLQSRNN